MNKKIMAVAMAAVMLMVAVAVGVSVQSDADAPASAVGTADNPRYIIGTDNHPVIVYHGDVLKGKMEFNRTAFTKDATVTFTYSIYNGGSFSDDSPTFTSTIATMEIAQDIIGGDTVPGKHTVTVTPSNVQSDSLLKVRICVTIAESICNNVEEGHVHNIYCNLPEQKYYYGVNINVQKNGAEILLEEGNDTLSTTSTTPKIFDFESDVGIKASVVKDGANASDGPYLYYATGLPSGLSMRIDGTIGGKIDKNLETSASAQIAKIYAVSSGGKVLFADLHWKIGAKVNPYYYQLNVDSGDIDVVGKYIAVETGTSHSMTIQYQDGYEAVSVKVTGADGKPINLSEGKYMIMGQNAGTGKFTVVVSAEMKKSSEDDSAAVHVVKSFDVYVVGKIVDADLDPSVSSR